jgi:hypothetical protein
MNISKRDIKMLLILFGIVIFVLCYFLVYLSYTEENEYLLEDIDDASFEYSRLMAFQNMLPVYHEAIQRSEQFILEAQAEYPTDIRAEDLIMYVVDLQQSVGIDSGGITFIQPADIMTVRGLVETENGGYSFAPQNAYRTGVNLNCSLTYQQLKDLVNYVYTEGSKASINSISLSYNSSTGLLYGSVVIHKNFLSSHDMEYVATQIPEMRVGLPNPFGVIRRAAPQPEPTPQIADI